MRGRVKGQESSSGVSVAVSSVVMIISGSGTFPSMLLHSSLTRFVLEYKQAAEGIGRITIPGSIQKVCRCGAKGHG